jgi:TM2 domain-containing membrane protein YozV
MLKLFPDLRYHGECKMNQAVKAAIFSALLFPGWGQIYLKRYKRGIAIILPVSACLISFCWLVIRVAIGIIKAAPLQKGTVDIQAIFKITADSMRALNTIYIIFILLLIIILWIFSIIDAYLLGKKQLSTISTDGDQQSPSLPV